MPRPTRASRRATRSRRRLAETADKEVWNGATLVGPHRDDMVFELDGRDLASFASRGQQRTAILALKLAELDLLTGLDGRPPLLLLDDVFSELDPGAPRRIWCGASRPAPGVRDDHDPRRPRPGAPGIATAWEVRRRPGGGVRWSAERGARARRPAIAATGGPGGSR